MPTIGPIINSKLTVSQVVLRSKERRREILKTLAPELFAEYQRLGKLVRELRAEQKDSPPVGLPLPKKFGLSRIPLFDHKKKLIDFLRGLEGAMRGEIIVATRIPAGSLSSLLKGKEFQQIRRGYWGLAPDFLSKGK